MATNPCGTYYTHALREGKGPRGRRRTFSQVTCVDCGRTSAERATGRPGSYDDALIFGREELHAQECLNPRVVPACDRLLLSLADHMLLAPPNAHPPLRWVVEYGIGPDGIGAAVARAFEESRSGYAIGMFLQSLLRKSKMLHRYTTRDPDGIHVRVVLTFNDGFCAEFDGADEAVANALHKLVATPWVGHLYGEPKPAAETVQP